MQFIGLVGSLRSPWDQSVAAKLWLGCSSSRFSLTYRLGLFIRNNLTSRAPRNLKTLQKRTTNPVNPSESRQISWYHFRYPGEALKLLYKSCKPFAHHQNPSSDSMQSRLKALEMPKIPKEHSEGLQCPRGPFKPSFVKPIGNLQEPCKSFKNVREDSGPANL